MGGEASAALGLKHVLRQHPLFGDVPVRLNLILLDVLIDGRTDELARMPANAELHEIESIHLALSYDVSKAA